MLIPTLGTFEPYHTPYNTILTLIMLLYFYEIERVTPPCTSLWHSAYKYLQVYPWRLYISAWWSYYSTITPSWCVFLLIYIGEYFCFVHTDKNIFKEYTRNLIHPSLYWKYFLICFLFHHFLISKGLHYFYIISLVVCLFLGIYCFGLKECSECWVDVEL